MSIYFLLAVLGFVACVIAISPLKRVRRFALKWLDRTIQVSVLAAIVACGLFAFNVLVPPSGFDGPTSHLPTQNPLWQWLIVASGIALGSLPCFAMLHHARELYRSNELIGSMQKELQDFSEDIQAQINPITIDRRTTSNTRTGGEVAVAVETLREVLGVPRKQQQPQAKTVLDVLNNHQS